VLLEAQWVAPAGGLLQLLGSGACTGGGVEAQVTMLESVCCDQGVDPREVLYVEAQHDFLQEEGGGEQRPCRREEELAVLDRVYGWRAMAPSSVKPGQPLQSADRSMTAPLSSSFSHTPLQQDEGATASMQLRQEKKFVYSSKATAINSGATWTLPLPVTAASASISYDFGSKDGDMIFAMYYITEKKKTVVVPQRLFDFAQDATCGHFDVRGPGTLYLRWANTHTWYGEKLLHYSVEIQEVR
jgi:hypothetical protein